MKVAALNVSDHLNRVFRVCLSWSEFSVFLEGGCPHPPPPPKSPNRDPTAPGHLAILPQEADEPPAWTTRCPWAPWGNPRRPTRTLWKCAPTGRQRLCAHPIGDRLKDICLGARFTPGRAPRASRLNVASWCALLPATWFALLARLLRIYTNHIRATCPPTARRKKRDDALFRPCRVRMRAMTTFFLELFLENDSML